MATIKTGPHRDIHIFFNCNIKVQGSLMHKSSLNDISYTCWGKSNQNIFNVTHQNRCRVFGPLLFLILWEQRWCSQVPVIIIFHSSNNHCYRLLLLIMVCVCLPRSWNSHPPTPCNTAPLCWEWGCYPGHGFHWQTPEEWRDRSPSRLPSDLSPDLL